MIKKFTEDIYKELVIEGMKLYHHMYESQGKNRAENECNSGVIQIYDTLTEEQKNLFFGMMRQIIIDSIASVFGVLDGSSNLNGKTYECEVIVDGVDMDHDLQDYFLSYVEMANADIDESSC